MKFRKMLPVLCMAMGLTFAIPLAAGATGTNSTAEATQKESAGWHNDSNGKKYYILENGNKAAGTRARKSSLEIEKTMKEFRKASLEASKQ